MQYKNDDGYADYQLRRSFRILFLVFIAAGSLPILEVWFQNLEISPPLLKANLGAGAMLAVCLPLAVIRFRKHKRENTSMTTSPITWIHCIACIFPVLCILVNLHWVYWLENT